MLQPGLYRHRHEKEYVERSVHVGDILLRVRETRTSFKLELVENTVRYDAPQIDDLFRNAKQLTIRKNGSRHAMHIWSEHDFTLYPYRVGVPYWFQLDQSA